MLLEFANMYMNFIILDLIYSICAAHFIQLSKIYVNTYIHSFSPHNHNLQIHQVATSMKTILQVHRIAVSSHRFSKMLCFVQIKGELTLIEPSFYRLKFQLQTSSQGLSCSALSSINNLSIRDINMTKIIHMDLKMTKPSVLPLIFP